LAKEPAFFFDDFFVVCHFWGGFAAGGYAVGGGMFNRRPDESDGKELASGQLWTLVSDVKSAWENCNEHDIWEEVFCDFPRIS
jgi:hypothetical protein